jgi:hypothetical protein
MAYSNIDKPSKYFNTVLYTGTGSNLAITGVGFKPDWVWCKSRSAAEDHTVWDAVRGSTARLSPSSTGAEYVDGTQGMQSFNTDGFTCGVSDQYNKSGQTQVSWCWLGANTTVSNTAGTITSTVSASTTSGFSIVGWTGTGATATVGHGLGTTPKMFIVRERSEARNWPVLTTAIDGSWDTFYLNNSDAAGNAVQSANSTVFNFTSSNEFNASGQTYIAYCFADIKGYSKFATYTGNGSTDGTFIYTGFKPAFVMIKQTSSAGEGWELADDVRSTYNVINTFLRPASAGAETTNTDRQFDFLSNGIKMRGTHGSTNASGSTYFYMAFAENPFVSSKGIPTTAR